MNAADDATGHMMSLTAASRLFPTDSGKRVSLISMRRWITEGVRGVRLEATFSAGKWWVTREAVNTFLAEQTRQRRGVTRTNRESTSHIMAELRRKHGI